MANINSITISRITGGASGEAALKVLNTPIEEIEKALNDLASGIGNINSKSAIIKQQVPIDKGTAAGDLVYYDYEHNVFKPALADTLGYPGVNGETVEAPCSRVEGMIVSVDGATNTGTLLCGGYYKSSVINSCLGSNNAVAGTYYLSPTIAGKAVLAADVKGHLRQPVLSYHGNGEFTMSIFYMAHDNHFHGSLVLGSHWVPATSIDIKAPSDAVWVYNAPAGDEAMINMGELTAATTAVFFQGVLQAPDSDFVVSNGYVWSRLQYAPAEGEVTIFNHYPFAYDSPVVRGVESTNASLSVKNKNGLIQLTQNAFIGGATNKNALAISAISDNIIQYTPVVTDLLAGPGMQVYTAADGSRTISTTSLIGTLLDAENVNHNGTLITSDGLYQYITFPKERNCSFTIQKHITNINSDTEISATAWCMVMGGNASFNVELVFVPAPTENSYISIGDIIKANKTSLAVGSPGNGIGMAESADSIKFKGNGTLIARITNSTSANVVNVFRTGFKLLLVSVDESATRALPSTPIEPTTAVTNSLISAYNASMYDLVYVNNGKLHRCASNTDSSSDMCVGIALSSCYAGESLEYMVTGIIQDPSFNFSPGESVYVGTDGGLTQYVDYNTMSYIQKVGIALTSTAVQISINPAIVNDR
jgi:hypothetical protein